MSSDWQYGFDNGLWGADGIPYGIKNGSWSSDYDDELLEEIINRNYFDTFEEASNWAKQNPGKIIVRDPTGQFFMEKK